MKTRTLKDLYVVGAWCEIDDGNGPVKVWLQKLNPVDHETALRNANARRARTLAMSRMPEDSDERAMYMNQLFDLASDRDQTIEFLAQERMTERYSAIEAEVAAEKEWSEDDYIQGLKDAWNQEMFETFALATTDELKESEEYIEAERVRSELERFNGQVLKVLEGEVEALKADYADWSEEKLIEAGINKIIESQANMNWLIEFRRSELWLGVLDGPKTKQRVFDKRSDVDELASEVVNELMQAYTELNVDSVEGKD